MGTTNNYSKRIEELKIAGNYRVLPDINTVNLLDLCSNDYLGLNSNEDLHTEFMDRLGSQTFRFSASSSRLLSGNSNEYGLLENLISKLYNSRSCLLYNSGYHANTGILPALADKDDLIVADKLVHASIIDGARLSKAQLMRYQHLNYGHLHQLLTKNRNKYKNVFIVSESIFSMDGDIADISRLIQIKNEFDCYLYLDEAHAVGTTGEKGLGCAEETRAIDQVDLIVGTFGKALASVGAYVICNDIFKQYLVNHSRTLIYTTALPPINLAWTIHIMEKLPLLNDLRERLKRISKQFAELLNQQSSSHIVPFIVGENQKAVDKSALLKQNGFYTLPIRYPTVPKGKARLRFSLRANMDFEQLLPIKEILSGNEQ